MEPTAGPDAVTTGPAVELLAAVLVELRRTNELLERINASGAYVAHAAFDARRAVEQLAPLVRARLTTALRNRRVRNLIGSGDEL